MEPSELAAGRIGVAGFCPDGIYDPVYQKAHFRFSRHQHGAGWVLEDCDLPPACVTAVPDFSIGLGICVWAVRLFLGKGKGFFQTDCGKEMMFESMFFENR
jgi:hypothetical protein